jgi:PAS domain S-box-containing protein
MTHESDKLGVAPRAVGKYLAQIAIVFAVWFVAGKIGQILPTINNGGIGPVWPASGIALAALLLFGYRVWPGVAAGAFLLALLSPGFPPLAAVVYGVGTTLEALTGMLLLRRVLNFDASISRLRDALGLIALGAFGSSVVGASIGASVLYAVLSGWAGFGKAWLIYWLGDSTGVLLLTPLVLSLPNLWRSHVRARVSELVTLLLLLTAATFVIFGDLPLIPIRLHVLAFSVLPFVIWAAIRFGVSGVTLSTFSVAAIATVETARGSGPFAQNTPFINAVLLDVFFVLLSASGMILAAVIAEREQAEREREHLVRKQTAMQARLRLATIVESSDDAIVGESADGIITDWNKGAEQLYGYSAAEVIGKPVSLLTPPDRFDEFPRIMEILRQGNAVKNYETVHHRKDGTRFEISLTVSLMRDIDRCIVGASAIARDISERKHQEAILRESEERLRVATEVGRMYAWEWDPATDLVRRSAECAGILGLSDAAAQGVAKDYLSFIHPDDRAKLRSLVDWLTPKNPVYRTQYRRFRPDGALLWLEESGCATFDGDGEMVRLVGMTADITERKLAEKALSSVSSRLIEAQERERSRIARELHDDISQRLALLTVELERLRQDSPDLPAEVSSRVGALREQASGIASDVQSMSHDLHSSKLEYLGIVTAMRGFCTEFSEKRNVEVVFAHDEICHNVPQEISLCLFRVLQEALQNAVKHSGVRHFDVELRDTSNEIQLTVRDSGSGFDVEQATKTHGLGLVSMAERVKLLGGQLSIDSQPHRGTTIHARVPLSAGSHSMHAAG